MAKRTKKKSDNDPRIIWVAPAGETKGSGTQDDPYTSLNRAIEKVMPGYTIMLTAGEYTGDVTFQTSGLMEMPIRVVPEEGAEVTIVDASWYFYDASDFIVRDLHFTGAPNSAISVIGACERNCFSNLSFVNCGGITDQSCTFFFGGDGGLCNVVENCSFEAPARQPNPTAMSIGLMISEGDIQDNGNLNRNHIFRNNTFTKFGCAIVIGSTGRSAVQFGHRVENNTINACWRDGIRIKCGDTIVSGNLISHCGNRGIALMAGAASHITDNRIENCLTGIHVLGSGHSIQNNCLVRCSREALHLGAAADEHEVTAANIIVEQNSCIDCGGAGGEGDSETFGVRCDAKTTAVIRRNIFSGTGMPYTTGKVKTAAKKRSTGAVVAAADDNIAADGCAVVGGCIAMAIGFNDSDAGNYENSSDYGCHGWMAVGSRSVEEGAPEMVVASIPDLEDEEAEAAQHAEDTDGEEFVEDIDAAEYFFKSGFYGDNDSDVDLQFEEDEMV
jgi:hypothetical protein